MFKPVLPSCVARRTVCDKMLSRQFLMFRPLCQGNITAKGIRLASKITTIKTDKSYAPIGHYSQAFRAHDQVWLAGQIAADIDGNLVKGSTTDQAHQICKNIDEILKAAGSSTSQVVKVTVFVTDFSLLPEFNAVYNKYFPQKPPRTSVEVTRLPLDVAIEVDVVAIT